MKNRIDGKFKALKEESKSALISFLMGGDGGKEKMLNALLRLPEAGVDIIEIGIPFSDPVADGKEIQEASIRSRAGNSFTVQNILEIVRDFRKSDNVTPIILMGYYNPIFIFGEDNFLEACKKYGVDGLIIVDLPYEECKEFQRKCISNSVHFIQLVTPLTNAERMKKVKEVSSGFVYFVSILGITGTKTASVNTLSDMLKVAKNIFGDIPVIVGFGVKDPKYASAVGEIADGIVVGSHFIKKYHESSLEEFVDEVKKFCF